MANPKKSGAQRRKEQKAAAEKQQHQLVAISKSWLEQPAYKESEDYWDPNKPATPLPIMGIAPPVFVKAVQGAVNQLEIGSFYLPAILWDGMTRDDRVSASLATRSAGLLGEPMKLDPADESDRALDIRDQTEKKISKIFPNPQLAQLQRYSWGLGVGVAQVKTSRTIKSYTPTIEVWNPRYLWWDWLIRKYRISTENRGTIVLDPEDPEWLIVEPFGPMGWMHGAMLRPLALPWVMRYWTRTWWIRNQEVHGQPIRLGIIPQDRTPKDESTFLSQMGNFAHEAVVRLPQGKDGNRFDMKLLEASSNSWQGFEKLVEHCDRSIEISILGQSQSTEGQGGLGSQEKAGESTLMRLIRGDALIGDILREKVLSQDALANYGDPELAPRITWEVEPPEDLEKKAHAFALVSRALVGIAAVPSAVKLVDMRALLESFQIPLLAQEDVPEEIPGTAQPGAVPEDENEGGDEDLESAPASGDETHEDKLD